ncbi:MAG: N-acetylmuramic acid 6-phosphate etherase [Cyanobacteriota bacterium ELA615]
MDQTRGHLLTELNNPNSQNLDQLSPLELVELFNQEDLYTIKAIEQAKVELAKAIEMITTALSHGGRLFYVGAGTSGRLGVLDAAECPPTFCTPPELVQAIIAGGESALVRSSEGLEDSATEGEQIVTVRGVNEKDVLVGIMAGGTTPYVHGALAQARALGAKTIAIACVPKEQVKIEADLDIRLLTGPEIVAGSTRLKAGTATKMALNILSTGVMVRLGKVHGNRMVDVSVTNSKLKDRALRILKDLTGIAHHEAEHLLESSGRKVKLSLLMFWTGLGAQQAQQLLDQNQGKIRSALNSHEK